MKIGNNTYKLIFLDTNALREIVTNNNNCGNAFIIKFFSGQTLYAPCFSIHNIIELIPYHNIYEQFLDFFSQMPCMIIFPFKAIIQEEYKNYLLESSLEINKDLAYVFSPFDNKKSYNFKKFMDDMLSDKSIVAAIKNENNQLSDTAVIWDKQRSEAIESFRKEKIPLNMINFDFYKSQEQETILKDLKYYIISPIEKLQFKKFPSLRIMEFSQFNRVYMTNRQIKPNDVMDVKISAIIPYVDAVITENFQAEVYKKAKSFIYQLKKLEIYTFKDLRLN